MLKRSVRCQARFPTSRTMRRQKTIVPGTAMPRWHRDDTCLAPRWRWRLPGTSVAPRRMGELALPTAPDLVRNLRHPDPATRLGAAIGLGGIGPEAAPLALPELRIALMDPEKGVRLRAAVAHGEMGSAAAPNIPVLINALNDPAFEVCSAAAFALALIGVPAIPALIDTLKHGSAKARFAAALALGNFGPSAASQTLPALQAARNDRSADVRAAVADALDNIRLSSQRP